MKRKALSSHSCPAVSGIQVLLKVRPPGFLLILLAFLPGCLGGGGPARTIDRYALEYPSFLVEGLKSVDATVRVEQFSAAQEFNSPAMVYRPGLLIRDDYRYHRWRVNAPDLVTDYLIRDLKNQGLFRAVFSYREPEAGRFTLAGEVEEFLEFDEGENRSAILGV